MKEEYVEVTYPDGEVEYWSNDKNVMPEIFNPSTIARDCN